MRAFRISARSIISLSAILGLCFQAGCDDDDGGDRQEPPNIVACDEAPVTGDTIERSAACELIDSDGWNPESDVPAGQARLGRVRDDVRPFTGPEARCGQDDFMIQNEHLRACISSNSTNQLWFTGGNIVDVEHPDNPGHEFLESTGPVIGLTETTGDNITILNDGSTGETAVLRVSGIDLNIKFEVGILGALLGLSTPTGLLVETEYRLAPDAQTLEIVTWFKGDEGVSLSSESRPAGDLLAPGVTADLLTVPTGLGRPAAKVEFEMFAAITEHASYGLYFDSATNGRAPTGSTSISILDLFDSSLQVIEARDLASAEDDEVAYRRWLAVGGPNTTDIHDAFRSLPSFEQPDAAQFDVTLSSDDEISSNARWLVERTDGSGDDAMYSAMGIVSLTEGQGTIQLAEGEYRARAIDWPTTDVDEAVFTVTEAATVALPAPDAGFVVAEVTNPSGEAIPATLRFMGERTFKHYDIGNREKFTVQAGTWDIEVNLGEEYSAELLEDVVVSKGETTTLTATLERTMDTTSWVSGDLHQHANRSFDSRIAAEARVLTNYAAGVDFFAPSEHDMVEDFPGIVARMGIADEMFVFQGEEVTSFTRHINAFPIPYIHTEAAGGAVATAERVVGRDPREVRQLSTPEMIAAARARGAELIQLNHARGELPYLDDVDYDPVSGEPQANLDEWIEEFEALEVFNDFVAACDLMRDWASFLRHGRQVAALGNSDTHDLEVESGWPRNYVFIGSDAQEDISDAALVEAMKAGRVSVSGGLFIDFTDGARPGDTIVEDDGVYDARLRIQSPSWAGADVLVTYVNGIESSRQNIDSTNEDIVDFDEVVSIPLTEDAFVYFVAFDNENMTQVIPSRAAFGMTNPVYVDVDGGGYEPPGVASMADVPLPTGLPWCD